MLTTTTKTKTAERLNRLHRRVKNKHLRRMIPFKGNVAWEVQVGPFVLMWSHRDKDLNPNGGWFKKTLIVDKNQYEISLYRLLIWTDPFWLI